MRFLLHTETITARPGGATLTMVVLLQELQRRGHEVHILARSSMATELRGIPVSTARAPGAITNFYAWADVLLIIRRAALQPLKEYKLWHEHHGYPPLYSVYFSHNIGQPYRHGFAPQDVDLVVFNSNWVRDLSDWEGASIVMHPPVVADHYRTTPGKKITQINLASKKGGSLFWEIVRLMPEHEFLALKSGDDDQVVPAIVPKNVTVVDFTNDMKSVYGQSRVLLMPSQGYGEGEHQWQLSNWTESYGRVGVEAAVSGIPVLATRTPGIVEALGDGATYIDLQAASWAAELLRLDDESYWKKRSQAAIEATKNLNPEVDVDRFLSALQVGMRGKKAAGKSFFPAQPFQKPAEIPAPRRRSNAVSRAGKVANLLAAAATWFLLTPVSHLTPKKRRSVLVMAPQDGSFSDNAKYAYLTLSEDPSLRVTYGVYSVEQCKSLVQSGVKAMNLTSAKGWWTALRTYVSIGVANYAFWGTRGHLLAASKKVQLWHGAGVKQVALLGPTAMLKSGSRYWRLMRRFQRLHPTYDLLFLPSEKLRRERAAAFAFRALAMNGFVRNDILFGRRFGGREMIFTDAISGNRIMEISKSGHKLVLFAPTFRRRGAPAFDAENVVDWAEMNAMLKDVGAYLVLKLHPASVYTGEVEGLSNVFTYEASRDIYPYLSMFDATVTDISSIFADISLVSSNIIHFLPDASRLKRSWGLTQKTIDTLPGVVVFNSHDLAVALKEQLTSERQASVRSELHDFGDGLSGARMAAAIRSIMK